MTIPLKNKITKKSSSFVSSLLVSRLFRICEKQQNCKAWTKKLKFSTNRDCGWCLSVSIVWWLYPGWSMMGIWNVCRRTTYIAIGCLRSSLCFLWTDNHPQLDWCHPFDLRRTRPRAVLERQKIFLFCYCLWNIWNKNIAYNEELSKLHFFNEKKYFH